jgi:hypothetical protein
MCRENRQATEVTARKYPMSAFADSRKTLVASLECPKGHMGLFLVAVSTARQQRIDFLYS